MAIMFKNYSKNAVRCGRQMIDFQDGSLLCMSPNQVIEMDTEGGRPGNMMGWGVFFHPDLIRVASLYDKMKEYTFFSYEISESLHLSDKEKQVLYDCVLTDRS